MTRSFRDPCSRWPGGAVDGAGARPDSLVKSLYYESRAKVKSLYQGGPGPARAAAHRGAAPDPLGDRAPADARAAPRARVHRPRPGAPERLPLPRPRGGEAIRAGGQAQGEQAVRQPPARAARASRLPRAPRRPGRPARAADPRHRARPRRGVLMRDTVHEVEREWEQRLGKKRM